MPPPMAPFLTVHQLAGRWQTSDSSIRRMIQANQLEAVRFGPSGGVLRIPREAVEEFERNMIATVNERHAEISAGLAVCESVLDAASRDLHALSSFLETRKAS